DLLAKHGFDNDSIFNINNLIKEVQNKNGGSYVNDLLSLNGPNGIQQRASDSQIYQAAQEKQTKQLSDLNTKLANLTITGTEAINNFEINVVTRLSKALTTLKLQSVSDETTARIGEIRSGNNGFNSNYFNYVRQNSSARNQFGAETLRANSDFSSKVANDFFSVIDNFTK